MSETWAERTERQMRADRDRERDRAANASTWAEKTEREMRAEALEQHPNGFVGPPNIVSHPDQEEP